MLGENIAAVVIGFVAPQLITQRVGQQRWILLTDYVGPTSVATYRFLHSLKSICDLEITRAT